MGRCGEKGFTGKKSDAPFKIREIYLKNTSSEMLKARPRTRTAFAPFFVFACVIKMPLIYETNAENKSKGRCAASERNKKTRLTKRRYTLRYLTEMKRKKRKVSGRNTKMKVIPDKTVKTASASKYYPYCLQKMQTLCEICSNHLKDKRIYVKI